MISFFHKSKLQIHFTFFTIVLSNVFRYKSRRDERLIYWFLFDVSADGGVKNGFLRSTCEAIKNAILSPQMQAAKENIEVNIYYF